MKAKTIRAKSAFELESTLSESLADGYKPTLAIVFLSIKQDQKTVCSLLEKEDIQVLGSTTSGEFISEFHNNTCCVVVLKEK